MSKSLDLSGFNETSFALNYGFLYEKSPWIATAAWLEHLSAQPQDVLASIPMDIVLTALQNVVNSADEDRQLALICAHPDLAGKAAIEGGLTKESTDEQAAARLDHCSPEEFSAFQKLNADYKTKFGFPFVMAVRNSTRQDILVAFEQRLFNDRDVEFATALDNIHTIARLRLEATVC